MHDDGPGVSSLRLLVDAREACKAAVDISVLNYRDNAVGDGCEPTVTITGSAKTFVIEYYRPPPMKKKPVSDGKKPSTEINSDDELML